MAELAKRYYFSRGPAALRDFIWWSGLKAPDAREALELIKPQLTNISIDNNTYWIPQNMPTINSSSLSAYLLPGFDEYIIGYKDRSAIMDNKYFKLLNSGNGMLSPTILMGGKIVGTWRRTLKKNSVEITLNPFSRFTKSESALLGQAADSYCRFLKMSSLSLA